MYRTVACAVAFLSLSAAAMGAELSQTFRIKFPDGWQAAAAPADQAPIVFFAASPRVMQTGGNCSIALTPMAESAQMTQSQIDQELEREVDEAFWVAMFKSVPEFKSTKIEKWRNKSRNGIKVYSVKASTEAVDEQGTFAFGVMQDMVVVPGLMFAITCSALAEEFDREEDDFESIMASFEIVDTPVATLMPKGPAALTLYERAKFAGAWRVVTRDTPDLAFFGWRSGAGSFGVGGAGAWEVCSEAQYRGTCRAVTGDLQALPRGTTFAAGSVRRLPAGSNARVAVTLGADALAAAVAKAR